MIDVFSTILQNILSPAILFFGLGILAGFMKSDLEVPDSISRYLAIYLMMAIGFKGGVAISHVSILNFYIFSIICLAMLMSFVQPFLAYFLLRLTTKLDSTTAAAVSAHYGSISVVTFATACSFLKSQNIVYAGYIVAVLALMEAPAILSGLFIAHRENPKTKHKQAEKKLFLEIFTNGSILLLLGAFIIGWITGQPGMEKVSGFLELPFQGFLCLFLLDMGLLVSKNLHELKQFSLSLVLFGFYMPIIGGSIGLMLSHLMGFDVGTGTLFIVLCASASYIAVPAAIRLALPEAKTSIYIPMSLAITFPFNVIFGIPLYFGMASKLLGKTIG